jgi:putative methionine-R-sulfoxide reductase with GAF domain
LVTTLEPAIDLKIGELRKAETKKLADYQKAWGDYQRDKALLTPTGSSGMTMEQGAAAMQAEREALNGLKKAYWKALATADKAYSNTVDAAGAALTKTTETAWAKFYIVERDW